MSKGLERIESKVRQFQRKLYLKAKRERDYRFYVLYDKIFRWDILVLAWHRVKANGGSAGVDGVTFEQIEKEGVVPYLRTLQKDLRERTYKPSSVLRRFIEKANGKLRPLGISTIRDRIVQMACKIVIEPIFEADFLECSHGYRPARSAHDAVQTIARNLRQGYTAIYDADLQAYFDTIPHDKLLQCVARRVADRSVLHLLRQWLRAPVEDRDDDGRPQVSRPTSGTPQGGVISPLLANLYLHWFDVRFHRRGGPATWAQARLVRYADDFVIMARFVATRITSWVDETVEGWLGLTINRQKTRVLALVPDGDASLEFLGYTFRYEWGYTDRTRRFLTIVPSAAAVARQKQQLRALTDSRHCFVPVAQLVTSINRQLRGWATYFSLGYPRPAYRVLNAFVMHRLTIHLQRRSQRACRPPAGMTYYQFLTRRLGLVRL